MYERIIKRVLDVAISAVSLVVLSPLFVLIAIAIKVDSKGPVIFKQKRYGRSKVLFDICKFRTMVKNADQIGGGTTSFRDPRITKVGNFLRKTKMDEIPQFVQVLLGRMSLVGPRPELLQYISQYQGEELDILKVRPGITDYSSVEFVNLDEIVGTENADDMYEKLVLKKKNALRVKYAHTVSFGTDVYIFFRTAAVVLDKIVGFVTRGFGVSIHKADCPNVIASRGNEDNLARWVRAEWEQVEENSKASVYEALIQISAEDGIGVLAGISVALADMKVSISQINTQPGKDGDMTINIVVGCRNVSHYESIVSRLRSLPKILSVRRGFTN